MEGQSGRRHQIGEEQRDRGSNPGNRGDRGRYFRASALLPHGDEQPLTTPLRFLQAIDEAVEVPLGMLHAAADDALADVADVLGAGADVVVLHILEKLVAEGLAGDPGGGLDADEAAAHGLLDALGEGIVVENHEIAVEEDGVVVSNLVDDLGLDLENLLDRKSVV